MDKARDVRRGVSRFSRQIRQSEHKLLSGFGGDLVSLEKSKKKRLRSLSVVGKASSGYEMRDGVFDRDDELPSKSPSLDVGGNSKRFKLPKKFFEDCNGVDHAAVPRKLRSAMKKRNGESMSPTLLDSKKPNRSNGGVESPKKKSKVNVKQVGSDGSPSNAVSGPITKDEEEVVETLYALAGMFPNDDVTNRSKVDVETSEAIPSTSLEARQSHTTAFEGSAVTKVDHDSICPSRTAEVANPSSYVERSPEETVKVNSLNEPGVQADQLKLHNIKHFNMELGCSISQGNLHDVPLLLKSEPIDGKPVYNSVGFCNPSELSLDTGLKQSKQQDSSFPLGKHELSLGLATAVGSQLEQQHSIKESKRNEGPASWPHLSRGSRSHGLPLQFPAAKFPAWMDSVICASKPGSLENGFATEKVSRVTANRRSWKRCAAHVYISHLIRDLQMLERKEMVPLQLDQPRPNEGSNQGSNQGVHMMVNSFNGITNSLNGVVSTVSIGNSTVEQNSNAARSDILQHKRLHQDQQPQPPALTSGIYSSQDLSFNFLSLSAGGGWLEANNSSTSRAGNRSETMPQLHLPYLHSLRQHQTFVPLSLPSTRLSSALPDQLSPAATSQQVQLQLPSYLGSSFGEPPHTPPTSLTKQQQQLLQQQRLWAAQLAAQYRAVGTSASMAQFPTLQNGRQDFPTHIPRGQTILPHSAPSLEALGSKYSPISPQHQQQQQIIAITSPLPSSRLKRQDHYRPSAYEDPGGGLHAGSALPLQLLCNERL